MLVPSCHLSWCICGFHHVTYPAVISQTRQKDLVSHIARRRKAVFGHVRRLPEEAPGHLALWLAVDKRTGGQPVGNSCWSVHLGDRDIPGSVRWKSMLEFLLKMHGTLPSTAANGRHVHVLQYLDAVGWVFWPVKPTTESENWLQLGSLSTSVNIDRLTMVDNTSAAGNDSRPWVVPQSIKWLSTITRKRRISPDSESGGIPHLFGTSLFPHIGSAWRYIFFCALAGAHMNIHQLTSPWFSPLLRPSIGSTPPTWVKSTLFCRNIFSNIHGCSFPLFSKNSQGERADGWVYKKSSCIYRDFSPFICIR